MLKNQQSLLTRNLKPTRLSLKILEILVEHGVSGLELKEISEQLGANRSTTHRYLQTLVESGWVETSGTHKAMLWKPSTHFIKLAFNYRNAVREQIDHVQSEFKKLTGEDL